MFIELSSQQLKNINSSQGYMLYSTGLNHMVVYKTSVNILKSFEITEELNEKSVRLPRITPNTGKFKNPCLNNLWF